MTFSERMGIIERSTLLQRDSMTAELRNSLWNVLYDGVWRSHQLSYSKYGDSGITLFGRELWIHFFKRPVDRMPSHPSSIHAEIRTFYFDAPWHRVYDFIEFVLISCKLMKLTTFPNKLRHQLNSVLARELAGFRIIENRLVPITDQNEIDEVAEAIAESPYAGARGHLRQALDLMSNREAPDYRNSIKESISAVESAAREITGKTKATLGDALREIEKSGEIHGALRAGFTSIYGYTSDAHGIRHGMIDVANVSVADAKYFLVACAAFVNYLVAKNAGAA